VEELRALVVELVEANAGLREVIAAKDHQIALQERRIVELERRLGTDSSNSRGLLPRLRTTQQPRRDGSQCEYQCPLQCRGSSMMTWIWRLVRCW
jgi:hypothetical protein